MHKRDYPLDLSSGQLSTALEASFRSELLTKDDAHHPPTYAFRMDLWRLWIRRMHSLWQVLREEGLGIGKRKGVRIGPVRVSGVALAGAGVAVAAAIGWAVVASHGRTHAAGSGLPAPGPGTFALSLETDPPDANVFVDGALVSRGAYHGALLAGHDHGLRISAPDYADSTIDVTSIAGRVVDRGRIALRARVGDLRVETAPAGATVTIDGTPRGRSPVTVRDLPVPRPHVIEATSPGRAMRSESHRIEPATLTTVTLNLLAQKIDLVVTTDPPGAALSLDGTPEGTAPHPFVGLPLGQHRFAAHLDGYATVDTSVDVAAGTGQVHIALVPEAPGTLVIQGDKPAQMFVDGSIVGEDMQNSGAQKLRRGSHTVKVILVTGEVIDKVVVVRPGERAVFDFSKGTITRSP